VLRRYFVETDECIDLRSKVCVESCTRMLIHLFLVSAALSPAHTQRSLWWRLSCFHYRGLSPGCVGFAEVVYVHKSIQDKRSSAQFGVFDVCAGCESSRHSRDSAFPPPLWRPSSGCLKEACSSFTCLCSVLESVSISFLG
jgi:hypothetical protein